MKLFYMLTGRETEADIEEFAEFVKWMKQVRQKSGAAPRVVFSFGYMVRMPFTPLRHDPLILQERAWRAIGGRVKSVCETNGFEFRMSSSWSEYAATQVLARGGYSLHALLEQMSEAGCVTDSGLSGKARQALERWLDANGEAMSAEKPRGFEFPFGFLDDEESRRFLHGQYERAKQGLDVGYPGRRSGNQAESDGGLLREARALDELMRRKHRLEAGVRHREASPGNGRHGRAMDRRVAIEEVSRRAPRGSGQHPLRYGDSRGRHGNERG